MPNYRRVHAPGGTFFFTVKLANPKSRALTENIDILRSAVSEVKHQKPFEIIDMVILPDHLHAIWRLPACDANYSHRWQHIKFLVTHRLDPTCRRSQSKHKKRERGFWQRRFWEHTIKDDNALAACRAYCWINPVKHGLVKRSIDWPFSSFRRAVKRGDIAADWDISI